MSSVQAEALKFDITVKFSQMVRPDGALPGSLAYVFRRALAESGVSDSEFYGRLAGYVLESMPEATQSARNIHLSDMSRRFNEVDMSWYDFLTAMALLGFSKVGMNFV
jgi:hypothetical protein